MQETWVAKQEQAQLHGAVKDFLVTSESSTDYETGLKQGRNKGGVSIFWRKQYEKFIAPMRFGLDWIVGIEVNINDRKLILLNVYLPYECPDNECDYLEKLGSLLSIIEELDTTSVFIVGDWNSDVSDNKALFGNHLQEFCKDNGLLLSSKLLLPVDSFTYVSASWHTTSWLDHCICTDDAHNAINTIDILYDAVVGEDHIPFNININCECIPSQTKDDNTGAIKLDWSRMSGDQLNMYNNITKCELQKVKLPTNMLVCLDVNCKNESHYNDIDTMYRDITSCLAQANVPLLKNDKHFKCRPGWNDHVKEFHSAAREVFIMWKDMGKPRQGPIYELKKRANARYKYAVRYIKRHQNELRKESLANKLGRNNCKDFWREIKSSDKSKMPLPHVIDDVTGENNIIELWRKHFYELFNCLKRNVNSIDGKVDYNQGMRVDVHEVMQAISGLSMNKSCGMDGVYAENIKYSDTAIVPLLAMCFSSMLIHGYLPSSMISILLVPVIKDKVGKINAKDNYRPIALASVVSKLFERIVMNRIEDSIDTSSNQFGFKKKHSTDTCIYTLKELLYKYRSLNSTVFVCFLDASKAFDRINHDKLFKKLIDRGIPLYLIRVLVYWYVNQEITVKWGSTLCEPFKVTNGVRQGGILSPLLFNLYMDELSSNLNGCKVGCYVGKFICNHLMYADDIVLMAPSVKGLQRLINVCEKYGVDYDILYNPTKSAILVVAPRGQKCSYPVFRISGVAISIKNHVKYLGHFIADDLCDDLDITRQCKKFYVQANVLMRKFGTCSHDVKVTLFRCFCANMYTSNIWCSFKKNTYNKLSVSYNNMVRIMLGLPKIGSVRQHCVQSRIPSFGELIRMYVYSIMTRVKKSENILLKALECSDIRYKSPLRKYWRTIMYI